MRYTPAGYARGRACSTVLLAQFYILFALVTLGMPVVFCYVFFYLTEQPLLCNFPLAVNGRPWSCHNFSLSSKRWVSISPAATGGLVEGDLGEPRAGFLTACSGAPMTLSLGDAFPKFWCIPSPTLSFLTLCPHFSLLPPDSANQPSVTPLIYNVRNALTAFGLSPPPSLNGGQTQPAPSSAASEGYFTLPSVQQPGEIYQHRVYAERKKPPKMLFPPETWSFPGSSLFLITHNHKPFLSQLHKHCSNSHLKPMFQMISFTFSPHFLIPVEYCSRFAVCILMVGGCKEPYRSSN